MINIGIIGYGYWGTNFLHSFTEARGGGLFIVEPDPRKLELVQRRYPGVKATPCLDEILRDPVLDAVAIATPVSTHFDLAAAVLSAGKHVWLEKPMTETSLRHVSCSTWRKNAS